MRDAGIGSWPRRRARMTPQGEAFVAADGLRVSYAEVDRRTDLLAQALVAIGIGRGDRVAYLGLNSVEHVVTMFAAARASAISLPLNTRLTAAETARILQDASPSVLLWDKGFEAVVADPAVMALGIRTISVAGAPGHESLQDLLGLGSGDPIDKAIGLGDVFMVQYTSGTSGRPKGVTLTHGNVQANVTNVLVDLDLTSHERSLVAAPLFHTAALNQLMLPTFLKGGCSYLQPSWNPEVALDLIERERISWLFGVTTMLLSLRHHPRWSTADLSSLRIVQSGGAPLPEPLLWAFLDRGLTVLQGYGLTEASPGATMVRADEAASRVGSAGTACFFSDVRVVDPQTLQDVVDVPGEVLVQGPNVSPGYWRNDAATGGAFLAGGWLRTGDLGVMGGDGNLRIVDRLKDMIISGGENIYPAEVEQAIYAHPAVAEVAVIGVSDPHWGEVGRAVLSLKEGMSLTEAELMEHLDPLLARYKIPKSMMVLDSLPHNASGKLVKSRVKELWGDEPGGH